jgi:hypothetical protein
LFNAIFNRRTLTAGLAAVAAMALSGSVFSAEKPNPRFGRWKIKSNAPPPTSNIMTYEPLGKNGMKVTIDAVNKDGVKSQWGYNTNFDGKDEPLYGNPATDTGAVRIITPSINEIVYKKNGKVTQVLTNVLSPDQKTLGIIYMHQDPDGKTSSVTFATYEKMP